MPSLVLQTAQFPAYWKMKIQENRSDRAEWHSDLGFIIDLLWGYQFYGEVKNFLAYYLYLHFAVFIKLH